MNNDSLQQCVQRFTHNPIEVTIENKEANCVKLITTHSSKGLESPVVVIADANHIDIDECKTILENKLCILNRAKNTEILTQQKRNYLIKSMQD